MPKKALENIIARHNLLDYDWLNERLNNTNIYQLIGDFESFTKDGSLQLVKGTLQLARHILSRDKSVLGSQLFGRLLKYNEPDIQNLLEQIQSTNQVWLRPLTSTLSNPSEPLLYTLYTNGSNVQAVAISPDGKRIISYGDYLTIWNLPIDGEPITLSEQCAIVGDVVVTPDSQYMIANPSSYSLKMWNLANLEEENVNLYFRSGRYSAFNKIAISANGQYLGVAVPGYRGLILFNLLSQNEPISLKSEPLECVAFTPDNRYVIAGSSFGALIIWDLKNQNEFTKLTGHTHYVTGLAVTPDSKVAISASVDETLKVWDLQEQCELFSLSGHNNHVSSVAIAPDGHFAISGSWDKTVKVWNIKEKQEVATFYGHSDYINEVAVTPDGECAISVAVDGTLKAWDLSRLQHKDNHPTKSCDEHLNMIYDLVITPNGEKVISASADKTLKIWDVATGKLLHTLVGHEHVVCAIDITADGSKVVSASGDKTLKVWDVNQGVELTILTGHQGFVKDVVVIPSTQTAISASNDKTLRVWQLDDGKEIMTLVGHTDSVIAVAAMADGHNAISVEKKSSNSGRMIKVWDIESGKEKYSLAGSSLRKNSHLLNVGDLGAILITPDGLHLVASAGEHKLVVWDWKNKVEICTISAPSNPEYRYLEFESVVISLDNQKIVTGSTDGTIRMWDKMSGDELCAISAHSALVNTLALMPDGKRFVSASRDQSLKIWDLDSGAHVATFYGDGIFTTCVVAPNGTIIAGEATGRIHFLELMGV